MVKLRLSALLVFFLAALYGGAVPLPKARSLSNTTLLIIRHAEKPDSGDGLTPAGERRAASYVQYFKSYQIDGLPARFTHLIAASDSKDSKRPRLTIEPLAKSLHENIDLRFSDKEPDALAQELREGSLGHEVLICWRHGKIPALLSALRVDPSRFVPEGHWPNSIYDRVIELHFDKDGHLASSSSKLVKEHLMPGDEN